MPTPSSASDGITPFGPGEGIDWFANKPIFRNRQPDARPPSPFGLKITFISFGKFSIEWKDVRMGAPWALPIDYWSVRHTPKAIAGLPGDYSGNLIWSDAVLGKSKEIASRPSTGLGSVIKFEHQDASLVDGYVQVVAIVGLTYGYPSLPKFLNLQGNTGALPGDVRNVGCTKTNLTGYTQFDFNYDPPVIVDGAEFKGVHIHQVGWFGSDPEEVGSMHLWDGSTRTQRFTLREATTANAVTFYFVAIGLDGNRVGDYTTAPNITV